MKRSKRLNPVVEIAVKDTEAALVKVGETNSIWLQDKQQLDDLHRYKGEYLARFRQGDTLTMSAQKVLELRNFLVQLDQAIAAQAQQVAIRLRALEEQRTRWQQSRVKEQSLYTLVERYQGEELQIENKQELRDNDERNTAQWLRHRNAK